MKQWAVGLLYIFMFTFWVIFPVQSDSLRAFADQNFILNVGQRAEFDNGLNILFKSVVKDSRCPINVNCVWAGNGKVELEIFATDSAPKTVQLNTQQGPKVTSLKKYELQLLSLQPIKVDGVNIAPEEYSVTLRIVKE